MSKKNNVETMLDMITVTIARLTLAHYPEHFEPQALGHPVYGGTK
jgi:hypothetical protein